VPSIIVASIVVDIVVLMIMMSFSCRVVKYFILFKILAVIPSLNIFKIHFQVSTTKVVYIFESTFAIVI
jgi:hypothetical protein